MGMTSYIDGDGAIDARQAGTDRSDPPRDIAIDHDVGGDPACWLNRVCDACGRFVDDLLADACPLCGAPRA